MKQKITMDSTPKVSVEEQSEQSLSAAAASGFSEKTFLYARAALTQ